MYKVFFIFFILPFSLFGLENYKVFIKAYHTDNGELFLTLRQFTQNAQPTYLVVNTSTLQTAIQKVDAKRLQNIDAQVAQSPFGKLLYQSTQLTNYGGIREATHTLAHSVFLTMDMCPSQKSGYEEDFIHTLTQQNGKTPIAIAMTTAWLKTHEKAFEALVSNPLLDITWINHSHTHFYDRNLPNEKNFMRHTGTDIQEEILGVEQTLIERGAIPSIFFRFPGLIADELLMKELRETYFLVPISSHAWVAKEQIIKAGSIILIHGNKNEPQGIAMLEQKLPVLLSTFSFKPLREAFVH